MALIDSFFFWTKWDERMIHAPIKIVVGALLLLASVCALVLSCIPTLYRVHDDIMGFVLESAVGATDQAQFVIEGRLQMVRKLGDTLYRAAKRRDLIAEMQPWPLVLWAESTVVDEDISVLLFRPEDRGFLVTAYNTLYRGSAWPGHVYVVNFSAPG